LARIPGTLVTLRYSTITSVWQLWPSHTLSRPPNVSETCSRDKIVKN